MSTFDPRLLEETVIDEPNATKVDPVPEREYLGLVDDFKIRPVTTDRGVVPVMDVYWMIPGEEELMVRLNRDKLVVKQSVWIDLNADGSIAVGPNQNVDLGRLRAALGLNGKNFSFPKLRGAGPARILVVNEPDKRNPDDIYAKVVKVVPAK